MLKNICEDFYLCLSLNLVWNLLSPGERVLDGLRWCGLCSSCWYSAISTSQFSSLFHCLYVDNDTFKWFWDVLLKRTNIWLLLIIAGNDMKERYMLYCLKLTIHNSLVNVPFFLQRFKHKQCNSSLNCQVVELLIIINCYIVFFSCKVLPEETLSILDEILKGLCDKELSLSFLWQDGKTVCNSTSKSTKIARFWALFLFGSTFMLSSLWIVPIKNG